MIMISIDIYDNDLKIVQTLPAQMYITVTIIFYFGSGGFKREKPGGLPPFLQKQSFRAKN